MKKIAFVLAAALLLSCTPKKFTVVQIADAQLGFNAAEVSAREGTEYVNDLTFEVEYLKKAVEAVNALKPDAVVFTGDQVHRSFDKEQWEILAASVAEIDSAVRQFHIPGNHDVVISDKGVDCSDYLAHYPEDRFVYRQNGVLMVGLNSNLIKYNDSLENAQKEWLKAVLAKEKGEVSIIFSHHPFFLNDIKEEDGYFQIQKAKRPEYFEIFKNAGVNALYAGHLHDIAEGEYEGIPVKTMTSVAYQLGEAKPGIRVITVENGILTDEVHPL